MKENYLTKGKISGKHLLMFGSFVGVTVAFLYQQNYANQLVVKNTFFKKELSELSKENLKLKGIFAGQASYEKLGKIAQEKHGMIFDVREPEKIVIGAGYVPENITQKLRQELQKDEEVIEFHFNSDVFAAESNPTKKH